MLTRKFTAVFFVAILLGFTACSPAASPSETIITTPPTATTPSDTAMPTATTPPPATTPLTAATPTITTPPPATAVPPTPTETPTQPAPEPENAGVIRLYYYGCMVKGIDPASASGPHNIYSAPSNDGINFTEDPGVRFSYDAGTGFGITAPAIGRLNDGSWLMFISMGTSIVKAHS